MGKIVRPDYYKKFQCIASRCTDSCCVGWEIDIDDTTLEYYRQVEGDFGDRLKREIVWNTEEDAELPHFRQTKKERCPFLNDCNLCDIFIHLGEEHLSQICTHHPRFYDWQPNREEGGLGLCCEEAARLILTCEQPFELTEEEDGEPEDDCEDEDLQLEQELLDCLYQGRERIFHLIRVSGTGPEQTRELLDAIWCLAWQLQDAYDTILFPEDILWDEASDTEETPWEADSDIEGTAANEDADPKTPYEVSWSNAFWQEDYLRELIGFLKRLEINDTLWWKLLLELEQNLPALLAKRELCFAYESAGGQESGNQIPEERLADTGRFLFYFIYRHLLKAREDDNVLSHVAFALGSVSILHLLDLLWLKKQGTLTEWDQICLAKLYSKEIEYDEENTAALAEFLQTLGNVENGSFLADYA